MMPPLYICWLITLRCNLNCPHCFAPQGKVELTPQAESNIIALLRRLSPSLVSLTGGEPCLQPRLPEIATLCSKIAPVRLTTNGLLLTRSLLYDLSSSITEISISLDSVDQSILEFFRPETRVVDILTAMHLVKEHDIPLRINTVVNKFNAAHLLEIGNAILSEFDSYDVAWKLINLTENSFVRSQSLQDQQVSDNIFWSTIKKLEVAFPSLKIFAFDQNDMNSYCMLLPSEEIVFPGKQRPRLAGMVKEIQDRSALMRFSQEYSVVANAMLTKSHKGISKDIHQH